MSNRTTVLALLLVLGATMALGQTMSGTYTIKTSGGDFSSHVEAATRLSNYGVTGACTLDMYTGTYSGQAYLYYVPNSSTYPIIFRAADGETPAVTNSSYPWNIYNTQNVTIDGIKTTATGSYAFYSYFATKLKVLNCDITSSSYGLYLQYSDTAKIAGNTINSGSDGIYLYYYVYYDSIIGNKINASGYGINKPSSGSYAEHLTIANNMISSTSYPLYIYYHNYSNFLYNTLYNRGSGYVVYDRYGYGGTYRNNIYQHNGTSYVWYKYYGDNLTGMSDYNCFWGSGGATQVIYNYPNGYNQTLAQWQTNYGQDLNSINQDPLVGGQSNLHLRTGSPCIGAGTPITGITTDIDGDSRTTPVDIGADEYQYPGDPMSGVYTIKHAPDTTGDFQTFNGAIEDLQIRGQTGNVTFCAYEGTYDEAIAIGDLGNGSYTVTFTGTDTLGTPTGAALNAGGANYAVDLRGTKRVEFRNLTVSGYNSYGFYLYHTGSGLPYIGPDSCVIANCNISGYNGIYMYYGSDGNQIIGNTINVTSTYGIYSYGYSTSGYRNQYNVIANNAIYGTPTYGIYCYYNEYLSLYYNTVYTTGTYGFRPQYCYNVDQRNNIFRAGSYAYYHYYGDNFPQTSDYNCFWLTSGGSYTIYHTSYGTMDLATWQSYSSKDANSIQSDPLVVSANNLHLRTASPCIEEGTPIASCTLDFDGDTRDGSTPDIGCDEWTYPGDPLSGVYTVTSGGDFANLTAALGAAQMRGFAGDVRFDVYSQTYNGTFDLENIGNGDYRLAFRAVPGENVTVNAGGSYGIRLYNNQRIHIEGFNVTGYTTYGLYANSASSTTNTTDSCAVVGCNFTGTSTYGIYWYYGDDDSIIGNTVTGHSYGIYVYGYSSPRSVGNVIANNMVSGSSYGLYIYYQDSPKVYYNSSFSTGSYAFRAYYLTNLTQYDNIFLTNSSSYSYFTSSCDGTSLLDYNCYWTSGSNPCVWNNYTGDWTWWQSQGYDAHGLNRHPRFVSTSDLHLQDTSVCVAAGTPVSGITLDVDGNPRNASTPCIGADEVTGDIAVTNILSPGSLVPIGSPFTPQARIAHISGPATTVGVKMEIRKAGALVYSGASSFVSLGTGGVDTLDLAPPCTLFVTGTDYTADCWHTGAPDRAPANDTASMTLAVGNVDVEAYQITAPTASVVLGATVNPQVRLINRGDFAATAQVYFVIDDLADGGSSVKVGAASVPAASVPVGKAAPVLTKSAGDPGKTLTDAVVYSSTQSSGAINPGDTVTVTFSFPWTATPSGAYQARANVVVAYDTDPSNDSLDLDFQVILPDADVGVTQIVQPGTFVDTNTTFTPTAKWHNYNATDPATFTAWFQLESPTMGLFYNETVTITGLGAGMDTTLTFTDVSVGMDTGNWMARCSTYVAGDINHANDVAGRSFVVAARPPFAEGWVEVTSMPLLPSSKAMKRGGWLAMGPGGLFYATKGYKTGDFYRYDPVADTWTPLAEVQPGVEAKLPEKGCRGISDGDNALYMTKGNNTFGFWHYDISANTWTPLADVPAGPSGKKVKGGTDLQYVVLGDTGYVYMLKGYRTEFWRYNTAAGTWQQLANAPTGVKEKWDKGSWMTYDGANTIYAHKAKYYTGTQHEFWKYDIAGDSWGATPLNGMPLYGLHGGKLKKKKAKDGGAGAYYNGLIYALKGGNTQQFFMYDVAADTWTETDTIPTNGTSGKKRRVKVGGDFVSYGGGVFFALKGNKTLETWRYVIPTGVAQRPERSGVMAGTVKSLRTGIQLGPNPLTGGYATLRYSLPKAGAATVSVFDVTGRNVMERSLVTQVTGSVSLDMRSLSAGIYLVRLDAGDYSATHKLVIQH